MLLTSRAQIRQETTSPNNQIGSEQFLSNTSDLLVTGTALVCSRNSKIRHVFPGVKIEQPHRGEQRNIENSNKKKKKKKLK